MMDERPAHNPNKIPFSQKIVQIVRERGTLTPDDIDGIEHTLLLRTAGYSEDVREAISGALGFQVRGLPMIWGPDEEEAYSLMAYQSSVIKWSQQREVLFDGELDGIHGCMLCLKMGMGKTLQSLVHILSQPRGEYPSLIVVPKSVLAQWKSEAIERFFSRKVKVFYMHKDLTPQSEIDVLTPEASKKYDIVITTYETCINAHKKSPWTHRYIRTQGKRKIIDLARASVNNVPDCRGIQVIYGVPWHRVVLDESQRISNPLTSTYAAIMAIYGKHKMCLTGTPISNKSTDLWTQLRFLGYNGVVHQGAWKKNSVAIFQQRKLGDCILALHYREDNVPSPWVKPEDLPTLPEKVELKINIKLNEYESAMNKAFLFMIKECLGDEKIHHSQIIALLTRMRQLILAPHVMSQRYFDEILKVDRNGDPLPPPVIDVEQDQDPEAEVLVDANGKRRRTPSNHAPGSAKRRRTSSSTQDEFLDTPPDDEELLGEDVDALGKITNIISRTKKIMEGMKPDDEEKKTDILESSIYLAACILAEREDTARLIAEELAKNPQPAAAPAASPAPAPRKGSRSSRALSRNLAKDASGKKITAKGKAPAASNVADRSRSLEALLENITKLDPDRITHFEKKLQEWAVALYSHKTLSTKIDTVLKIVRRSDPKDKFLIFCSFSTVLGEINELINNDEEIRRLLSQVALVDPDEKKVRLYTTCPDDTPSLWMHAKTKPMEREDIIRRFKDMNKEVKVFAMTYRMGAQGLNLTQATNIILMDGPWNMATTNQAKARAWRIGQKNKVKVFHLIANNTIEEKILALCLEKMALTDIYVEVGKTTKQCPSTEMKSKLSREQLIKMLEAYT